MLENRPLQLDSYFGNSGRKRTITLISSNIITVVSWGQSEGEKGVLARGPAEAEPRQGGTIAAETPLRPHHRDFSQAASFGWGRESELLSTGGNRGRKWNGGGGA